MENVRKQDPTFTNFVPATAAEAVDRYVRCRKNGLKPMLVPECLIECARGLVGPELDKFENWIINPNADLSGVQMCEQKEICESNDRIFKANLRRVEDAMELDEKLQPEDEVPPLPAEYDTMFDIELDDEKMLDLSQVSLEPQRGTPPPSDR